MNRRQSPCSTLSREERRLGSDPSSYYSKGRAHEAHGKYLLTRRIFTTLIQPYAVSMEMPRHHSYRGETKLQPGRQPGSGSWTPNPQAGGPAQGPGPPTPRPAARLRVLAPSLHRLAAQLRSCMCAPQAGGSAQGPGLTSRQPAGLWEAVGRRRSV